MNKDHFASPIFKGIQATGKHRITGQRREFFFALLFIQKNYVKP